MANGQAQKKGLPALAWVAIGCGVLVVIGAVVVAGLVGWGVKRASEVVGELQENPAKVAAQLAIRVNPDLELVSTDDEAGTITFRNLQTDEEVTLDFDDVAEGRFTVTTEEGQVTLSADEDGVRVQSPDGEARIGSGVGDVPEWLPLYPGAETTQGSFINRSAGKVSGVVGATSSDSPEDVADYYEQLFEERGWEVDGRSSSSVGDQRHTSLRAKLGDQRTVMVAASSDGDDTEVVLTFEGDDG